MSWDQLNTLGTYPNMCVCGGGVKIDSLSLKGVYLAFFQLCAYYAQKVSIFSENMKLLASVYSLLGQNA